MVWKILRPRAWMLYRQFWLVPRRARAINLSFIGLLAVVALFALGWLGTRMAGPAGVGVLAAFLPTVAMMLLFFGVIQIMDALYQMFLSPDLPWVLRAPVSYPAIFGAKLIEVTFIIWLPVLFSAALLVTLGVTQAASPAFYPLALIDVLSLAVGVSAFEMILVCGLARLVPPKRLRELTPVLIGVASLGSVAGQQWMLRSLAETQVGMRLLLTSLLDIPSMALGTTVLAGGALVATGLAYLVFRTVYFDVYSRLQIADRGRNYGKKPVELAQYPERPGRRSLLPAPYDTLFAWGWKSLRRDTRQVTNLLLVPLSMVAILIPMFTMDNSPIRPLIFWILLVYASLFAMNSAMGLSLTSFTQDGQRFAWLRISPVRMSAVLWSKFWLSWIPVSIPWAVFIYAGGLLMGFPGWQIAALLASVVIGMGGTCAICVAVSAQEANFSTATPNPKLTGPAAWGALGLSLISHLIALVLVVGVVLRWAAASDTVAITRSALQAIPGLGWIGATAGVPFLLAGLATLVPFGYVVWRLWASATQRLENWEMV